jgi:signal transduction histidine kinase
MPQPQPQSTTVAKTLPGRLRRVFPLRTWGGFMAAFVALVVIAVISLRSAQQLMASRKQVIHTLEVLSQTELLLSLLKDAETGQRGYLLVQDPRYLEPYLSATRELEPALHHLRQLTSDNPIQQERINRLEAFIQGKLSELSRTLKLAQEGDLTMALELVRTDEGKRLMDASRKLLEEVQHEERRLLTLRTEHLNRRAAENMALVLGGISLLGGLTLLAAFITSRDFFALNQAARERERYEERLVALHEIDKAILRAASPEEVVRSALAALRRGVGCERADLLLFEPEHEEARALICDEASPELREEHFPLLAPLRGEDPGESGPRDLSGLPEPLRQAHPYMGLLERGLRYEVRLPLRTLDRQIGSLGLNTARPEALDARSVQVAREVAAQVSIALEQTRLRERLQGEAGRLEQQVRARTVELNEANAELEAFSYSVSHDLRAPLRAIDGFAQAVEDDPGNVLTPRSQRFFGKVKAASARMAELIDGLLNLSRLSRAEVIRERVDLSRLAVESIAELQAQEPQRRVDVSIQEGLWAEGDRRLLRVLLDNLLGNAWKFSGQQPDARIELACTPQPDESVFSVRDNGAGFDMAYAQKLFSPFQRMHSDREFPGTGIGLATVHRIVRRHGGRIWAESRVGEGATIFFTLGGPDGHETRRHPAGG